MRPGTNGEGVILESLLEMHVGRIGLLKITDGISPFPLLESLQRDVDSIEENIVRYPDDLPVEFEIPKSKESDRLIKGLNRLANGASPDLKQMAKDMLSDYDKRLDTM